MLDGRHERRARGRRGGEGRRASEGNHNKVGDFMRTTCSPRLLHLALVWEFDRSRGARSTRGATGFRPTTSTGPCWRAPRAPPHPALSAPPPCAPGPQEATPGQLGGAEHQQAGEGTVRQQTKRQRSLLFLAYHLLAAAPREGERVALPGERSRRATTGPERHGLVRSHRHSSACRDAARMSREGEAASRCDRPPGVASPAKAAGRVAPEVDGATGPAASKGHRWRSLRTT